MTVRQYEYIGRKIRPVEAALLVKFLLNIKRQVYRLKSYSFFIDPISDFGLKLQKYKNYEPNMTSKIEDILKPGDTFIDLGANEGYFSIVASRIVGKKGSVLSIEPQQRLWEIIVKNYELNNALNCKLLPYATGASNGSATIYLYSTLNSGASSLSSDFNFHLKFLSLRKTLYGKANITIKRLDDIISDCNINKVDLIKIDIEGYELEAIKGFENFLKSKKVQKLLIEVHPNALQGLGQSVEGLINVLLNYGYIYELVEKDLYLFSLSIDFN